MKPENSYSAFSLFCSITGLGSIILLASATSLDSARAAHRPFSHISHLADTTETASLDGVVTDSLYQPIAGVEVYSIDGRAKVSTNSVGAFSIRGLKSGRVTFEVRKIGYGAGEFTLVLDSGATRHQTIVLTRLNNVLTPVVVEELPSHRGLRDVGFYERAGNSRGTFLAPEVLAKRGSGRTSDFLRGVNGVLIASSGRSIGGLPWGTGGYTKIGSQGVCLMNLYIDGSRVELGSAADRGLGVGLDVTTLDDVISANDVGAIEVYPSGVSGPPKYSGVSRGCGTILIWTKSNLNMPRSKSRN